MKKKFLFVQILFSLLYYTNIFAQQINIPRIEQMPNLPTPYEMRNWKEVALGYDSLVFDLNRTGQYLPLVWINNNTTNYPDHSSFGLHTVVGTTSPTNAEAINCLPAVVGASLCGIDKSSQNGYNWVLMCEEWFNKRPEMNVYKNQYESDQYDDWWYETMPNVFFYQLYDLYPGTGDFDYQFTKVADRWLEAVQAMGGSSTPWTVPNMNHRGWDFINMKPYDLDVKEPEAAGAIAWILYNAYLETGNQKYRMGAEWCLEFLNSLLSNPSYEIQLPYGVYTVARMNAEIGTNYNTEKLLNWCFSNAPLRNWGIISGKWGIYDVQGLVGELSPRQYAFSMNTFEHIGALVPLVRYDERFARAIGKWVLNASNSARLFYTKYLSDLNQDSETWSHQYDPGSYIAHEALLRSNSGWPYATGDAIDGNWGATNLSLYSSSHAGILGGIIDTTNVPMILKLDLLKTDYFKNSSYPTYLYYNPYNENRNIEIDLSSNMYDLYDAVSNVFIKNSATGLTSFDIPSDQAMILVLTPAGRTIEYILNKTLVNGIVIDFNNGQPEGNHKPRIKGLGADTTTVIKGSKVNIYCTAEDSDNDQLSYIWSALNGQIHGSSDQIEWTAPDEIGEFIIKVIVDDGKGSSDSSIITIEVAEFLNHNPIIIKMSAIPRKIDLGSASTIKCDASDQDNDTLTFIWDAANGLITGIDNQVIWQAPAEAGDFYVKCTVNDNRGGTAVDSISLEVRDFSIQQTGNLIAYYPFNGNTNDESGNSLNGTQQGGSFVEDRFRNPNSAFSFNGTTDYIRVTNNPLLNFTNSITINFWLKVQDFLDKEEYPISHGSWDNRWKISLVNQKSRWTIKTDRGIKDLDSETQLQEDSLYNITAAYNGSDMELYLNGNLDAFTSWSGSIAVTNVDLTIGQMLPNDNNYNYKGILDDIRIYDYALPFDVIGNLYDIETGTQDQKGIAIPVENLLHQNYPNPFNNSTNISYQIKQGGNLKISIYDLLGRRIRILVDEIKTAGYYSESWDGLNENGNSLSSGIYFYSLSINQYTSIKKLVMLK